MRIALLGPLEVRGDDGTAVDVPGMRLRTLLIRLALEPGRVVTHSSLVDAVWVDEPPANAANALQALVSRLRRAVPGLAVEPHPAGYRLALPPDAVDLHHFERLLSAGAPEEALALWRGPVLADVADADFARAVTARLEELHASAREEAAEAALDRGEVCVEDAEELAAAYPLRERPVRLLMRSLHARGRTPEALAAYGRYRRRLADTLGTDPSPELNALHLTLLRDSPAAPSAPGDRAKSATATASGGAGPAGAAANGAATAGAGSAGVAAPSGAGSAGAATLGGTGSAGAAAGGVAPLGGPAGLPAIPEPLTSFIGREGELADVLAAVGAHRLVTLTGPGGTGKTRLAIEAARAARLPDGVALVELAPVTEPDEVPYAVALAVGLREQLLPPGGRGQAGRAPLDATARLAQALAHRAVLIVLDNCEHLIDAVAHLAGALLAACPRLRVLATSREPLGLTGEALLPVAPLAVPPADADAREAAGYAGMRLLTERAAAGRPGFALDDANAPAMVRLCRALDGVPLAIELAAARLRTLPPELLADRLGDRFRLLTGGSRTALPRHQTLRAVVDWSWDLLTPAERAVWRRLSVFAGGATVEAAEAVCAGADVPAEDVLDLLGALADKSILRLSGDRYGMLETIREYGVTRLDEAAEHGAAVRAHSAYFLALAETAEPHLRRAGQLVWRRRLGADHDNLLAALRRAVHARDTVTAVRFCAALGWYWWLSGYRAEGGQLTAESLDLPAVPTAVLPEATVAVACATGALNLGDAGGEREQVGALYDRAVALAAHDPDAHPLLAIVAPVSRLMHAIDLAGAYGADGTLPGFAALFTHPDPWVAATARAFHAHAALNLGQSHAEAVVDFLAALDGYRSLGDGWGMALVLEALSTLDNQRGEYARAAASAREAIELLRTLGATEDMIQLHMRLFHALWMDGRRDEAVPVLAEAQRLATSHGVPVALAGIEYAWSNLHRLDGDLDRALRRADRAAELIRGVTVAPQFRAVLATEHGLLAGERGDLAAARDHHTQALEHALSAVDSPIVGHVLVGRADLALREQDPALAARLLGAAAAVNGAVDRSLIDLPVVEQAARSALGDEAFSAAYRLGQATDLRGVRALAAGTP
ncbi:BTAD domain-containing putative transcriptional regulator [Catellatospora sp. NPDC049609]|uniref:AfsR/SARP family transcriptional regulator n=1 Tax=Catellatospora sp. NPDC049609 TaxID=3155505 RepID=UPI003422608B